MKISSTMPRGVAAAGCALALAMSMTPMAFAASGSVVEGTPTSSNTATTAIYVSVDDSQLSVTAPTEIHLVMGGDGTFTAPTGAKITNNSTMPIAVKSVKAESLNSCTGVTESGFNQATGYNVFYLTANDEDIAVENTAFGTDWNMTKSGSEGSSIALALEGRMKNIDTARFGDDVQISRVTWTVGATLN